MAQYDWYAITDVGRSRLGTNQPTGPRPTTVVHKRQNIRRQGSSFG